MDFRKGNDVTIKIHFLCHRLTICLTLWMVRNISLYWTWQIWYWQVPVEESNMTAFVIPGGGQFEFVKMAFGLTNALPTFQRLMSNVLAGLLNNK